MGEARPARAAQSAGCAPEAGTLARERLGLGWEKLLVLVCGVSFHAQKGFDTGDARDQGAADGEA